MKQFNKIIDGTSLGIFRIGFGIFMLWELFYMLRIDFVEVFLTTPQVHFPYLYLEFLPIAPSWMLYLILFGLIACAGFIAIGRFYRVAMISFFLGFSYIFLLDKAYYNNHLYLVCLISFLLIFIPADEKLSFRRKKQGNSKNIVYLHLFILRLQLALVYFFGGVAKLNTDWLIAKEPARTILRQKADANALIADFLTSEAMLNFVVYGGLLFDLFIGFLLFIPKVRKWAILVALVFNITNAFLFDDINIFPYFMILSLILFMDTDKVFHYVKNKAVTSLEIASNVGQKMTIPKYLGVICIAFFIIQFLLPLRHFLYEGNTEWTGHGQRFAWRMKIQNRSIKMLEFKVKDFDKKIIYPTDFRSYGLNRDQINLIGRDPYAVVQYAQFLKAHARTNKGIVNAEVVSNIEVSMNGRALQKMFDTTVDISALEYNAKDNGWVIPLTD